MASKSSKRFLEEAKRIMDDNIHVARFNETARNVEKLKNSFIELTDDNSRLREFNEHLKNIVTSLTDNNKRLSEQVNFLEEILNSLQVLVSVKDINHRNLLWYNENYVRLLGYRHKQLQELNCEESINLYHPEDYEKLEERNKHISDSTRNRYSCVIRLKHVNGTWFKMNSDYIVLKRNPDGSQSQALEILSGLESA